MNLAALISADDGGSGVATLVSGPDAVDIAGLALDSRDVRAGTLFAALPGAKADGSHFVAQAVAKGAAAVLVGDTASVTVPDGVALLRSPNPRRAIALMAARFFPKQPPFIVAITGTNGKTSIAEFTRQICAYAGHKAASLGTIGVVKADGAVYGSLTTPDPITLHKTLDALAREGITHLAIEASSHGLDQYRLDGVRLTAAAFNNLGRDHLDYHPTIEAYLDAKLRLFRELMRPGQVAVVNADGPMADRARNAAQQRGMIVCTTGLAGGDLRLVKVESDGFEQRLVVGHGGKTYPVRLPLLGTYQATNALVAAALAMACGVAAETAIAALEHLGGVKGRLEVVGRHNGGIAVVDYAHKPEALEAALDALRPFASGKIITVFGCGGDRDRGKRPVMGEIASRKSDIVIVTDDNPRSEDPAAIRAEVLAGAPGAKEIGDRALAIAEGIKLLGPGDVLLVAGKGHESGQIAGTVTTPFLDHDAIAAAIAGRPYRA